MGWRLLHKKSPVAVDISRRGESARDGAPFEGIVPQRLVLSKVEGPIPRKDGLSLCEEMDNMSEESICNFEKGNGSSPHFWPKSPR